VGYFGHWVVARGASWLGLRRLGLHPEREEAAPGWRYAYGRGLPDELDLHELVARAARSGNGAGVGAWIFDSDYGLVVGRDRNHIAAVSIDPEYPDERLEHHPDAFAAWSACAPNPLRADEVDTIARNRHVFAEHTVDELFDRLGLPAPYDPREPPHFGAHIMMRIGGPGRREKPPPRPTVADIDASALAGYVAPLGFMWSEAMIARERRPWRELRYVPGIGNGFLGIWDREAPDEPVRFPVSKRGEARLEEELERLQLPLVIESMRAEGFGGFVAPESTLHEIRVAGRDVRDADARYVLGKGDGFLGVWDREQPADAIRRFPGEAGWEAAREAIHALMFQEELGAKVTPGLRLFRRPSERRSVDLNVPRPRGLPRSLRRTWDDGTMEVGGNPWLIVEEDDDPRWRPTMDFTGSGRYYVYGVEYLGDPLECRGRFDTLADAQAYVDRVDQAELEWEPLPDLVPRNLQAALRWVEREQHGIAGGAWYERFDWVEPTTVVEGARGFAPVLERGVQVAVLLAVEYGPGDEDEDEAGAYLLRHGDSPRFVYSLPGLEELLAVLPNYVAVDLGPWQALEGGEPVALETLARELV
jgi:hypothetical protein